MPITYGLNMFGLSFASLSALIVWVILEHRQVMASAAKRIPQLLKESIRGRPDDKHVDIPDAAEVPVWWYLACCPLALFMAIFAVEYWNAELQWYGVLLACAVALVFYPPVSTLTWPPHGLRPTHIADCGFLFAVSLLLCMQPRI